MLDDRQPESRARLRLRARRIGLVEALEDLFALRQGNARTPVLDRQEHAAARYGHRRRDALPFRRELHRVVEQVVHDLDEAPPVARATATDSSPAASIETRRGAARCERSSATSRTREKRHGLPRELERPGLDPRKIRQVLDQDRASVRPAGRSSAVSCAASSRSGEASRRVSAAAAI